MLINFGSNKLVDIPQKAHTKSSGFLVLASCIPTSEPAFDIVAALVIIFALAPAFVIEFALALAAAAPNKGNNLLK